MKTATITTKEMVPDYGRSQHKNHFYSKTRLPDCHCQQTYSYLQTKTPCHFVTQSIKKTHVEHFQL